MGPHFVESRVASHFRANCRVIFAVIAAHARHERGALCCDVRDFCVVLPLAAGTLSLRRHIFLPLCLRCPKSSAPPPAAPTSAEGAPQRSWPRPPRAPRPLPPPPAAPGPPPRGPRLVLELAHRTLPRATTARLRHHRVSLAARTAEGRPLPRPAPQQGRAAGKITRGRFRPLLPAAAAAASSSASPSSPRTPGPPRPPPWPCASAPPQPPPPARRATAAPRPPPCYPAPAPLGHPRETSRRRRHGITRRGGCRATPPRTARQARRRARRCLRGLPSRSRAASRASGGRTGRRGCPHRSG